MKFKVGSLVNIIIPHMTLFYLELYYQSILISNKNKLLKYCLDLNTFQVTQYKSRLDEVEI